MTSDERYAQQLRERFPAPTIDVDPVVLVRRARRRRTGRWAAVGAVAVLVVVAVGWALGSAHRPAGGLGPAGPSGTPTAEPSDAPAALWVSSTRVPPGADLVVALVDRTGAGYLGGVGMTVERWDGRTWRPAGSVGLAWTPGSRGGHVTTDRELGVPAVGILAGSPLRMSTVGLAPGWYRLSEPVTRVPGDGEPTEERTVTAAGQFEVADDAPQPPPLDPVDEPLLSVSPGLLTPSGGAVTVALVVPETGSSGPAASPAATDPGTSAHVQRWADGDWSTVADVTLAGDPDDLRVDVPPLPAGTYRLAVGDEEAGTSGWFWVGDTGPTYLLFMPDEPVPDFLRTFADAVTAARTDPDAPAEFRSRAPLASCGSYVVDQGVDAASLPWSCLTNGRAGGAEMVMVRPTSEGDPIVTFYRTGPGVDGTDEWVDATADQFGPQAWQRRTCPLPEDREPLCE